MQFEKLTPWDDDGAMRAVVESPRGATVKLKYDPDLHAFALSRPLVLGTAFPFDFGFVPGTRAEDGDPLDVMVLLDAPTAPGVVVACRPIAVLRVSQEEDGERERNDRLIAVACADEKRKDVKGPGDLSAREKEEIEQFFVATTALEGKKLRILGWGDAREAKKIVDRSTKKRAKAA